MTLDLTQLMAPGPTRTRLSKPFWEAAAQGRLTVQRCDDCGQATFYPREICPHCWGSALRWETASGNGLLKTFSVVYRPGHPAWQTLAPYSVGLVELVEGPTMLSHILAEPETLRVGQPMRVVMTRVGAETLPFFTPAPATGETR